MTVEPFELIENYARHHDAYVRRNVAIAISTLPDEPSVAALVDMATSDPDEQVRETVGEDTETGRAVLHSFDSRFPAVPEDDDR